MSSIKSLGLRGIRSFGPDTEEGIEFYSPLTVIVGPNGCGKTTIIECLKYATTGSLPPGSKSGQAFVHDPKLAELSEVKAQVRLSFKNRAKQRMYIGRSLQLTQKRNKMEFKALDGVVTVRDRNGKKTSQTHRCSDLDKAIPEYFGVSKPILENVIFCHQEDSNWPLQEGAVLKKKFDDIFESTRYTKALETIKKQRKLTNDEYKRFKGELDVLTDRLQHAEKKRAELHGLEAEFSERKALYDQVGAEIAHRQQQLDAVKESIHQVKALTQDIAREKVRVEERELSYSRSQADLTENERKLLLRDANDLAQSLSAGAEDQQRVQRNIQKLQSETDALRHKKERTQEQLNTLNVKRGSLAAEVDALDTGVARMKVVIQDNAVKYGIQAVAGADADAHNLTHVEQFHALFTAAIRARKEQHNQKETSIQTKLDQLEDDVNTMKQKENALVLSSNAKAEELRKSKLRLDAVVRELDQVGPGGGSQSQMEIKRVDDDLARVEAANDQANAERQIGDIERQVRDKRASATSLAKELHGLASHIRQLESMQDRLLTVRNKQSDLENKRLRVVRHLQERAPQIQRVYNKEQCKCPLDFSQLETMDAAKLGRIVNSLLNSLQGIAHRKEDSLAQVEQRMRQAEKDFHLHSSQREAAKKHQQKLRAEVEQHDAELRRTGFYDVVAKLSGLTLDDPTASGDNKAMEIVQLLQQRIDRSRVEYQNVNILRRMLKKHIRKAKTDHSCPTCLRSLDSFEHTLDEHVQVDGATVGPGRVEGVDGFVAYASSKLQNGLERDCETAKNNADQATTDLKSVQLQLEVFTKRHRNKQALGEADANWNALFKSTNEEQAKLQTLVHELNVLRAGKTECDNALQDIKGMVVVVKDMGDLSKQIETEEQVIASAAGVDSTGNGTFPTTLEAARQLRLEKQKIMEAFQQERDDLRDQVEGIRKRQQSGAQRLNELRAEKIRLQEAIGRRATLTAERLELVQQNQRVQDELQALEPQKIQVARETSLAVQHRNREKAAFRNELEVSRKQIDDASRDLHEATAVVNSLRQMLQKNAPRQVQAVNESLRQKQTVLESTSNRIAEIETEKGQLEAQLGVFGDTTRTFEKLIELKSIQGEIASLQEKIATLEHEKQQALGPSIDAQVKVEDLDQDVKALQLRKAKMQGQLSVLQRSINTCKEELGGTKYRKIDEEHREKSIQVHTTHFATSDLDKYYKALDGALMQFHAMKIAEINKRIRELWQITYRGGDIDRIDLRSDPVETGTRRSYNYRLVMTKSDTEMDMRGRCSAGQKVLASLVIRLALAETFSVNCGILTLDEPTTNLDHDNKVGFANALGEIINARSGQENFQLVVITHDEDFVDMLKQANIQGGMEHYFRVSRTEVGNKYVSQIHKQEWED